MHTVCVLTVEAEVLGVGLCHKQLEAFAHKLPHRPGVCVWVARRKALVGRVKERKQTSLLLEGKKKLEKDNLVNVRSLVS